MLSLLKRIEVVLHDQFSDYRKCPFCRKDFITQDRTSDVAVSMWKEVVELNKRSG